MTTIKLTFAAVVLLVVGWTMVIIQPMIPALVSGAADAAAFVVRSCTMTGVVTVIAVGAWVFMRSADERNRQRDGAFPLREYHLEPLPKRAVKALFGKPSPRVILDVNAMMTHGAMIYQGIHLAEPPAGWDRQLAYMGDIERTRRVQAAIVGDGVLGNPFVNLQRGIGGVANAATGRMLAGAYDKAIKPQSFVDAPPEQPAPMLDVAPITPAVVAQESKPAALVMGQTEGGELVRWDLTQTPHLRFHGMTRGSGKTNAIQTVAAAALTTGAHVVVFDRVQFKDWGDFDGHAELVDTSDPRNLADGAARVLTIYHNRTKQLAKAGVRDVSQMTRPMRRIVVIVPEFGAQYEVARDEGVGDNVVGPLKQLARLAGATGIHLVFEDQVVDNWPRGMTANIVPVIGKMPAYAGQACGFIGRGGLTTDRFPPFTFWYDGALFKAPHVQPELSELLAEVPAPNTLVMLTPPYAGVQQDSSQGSSQPVQEAVHSQFTGYSPEVAPPPAAAVNYPVNTTPTTVEGWYEWTLDNYLPAHLELLQTDDRGRGIGVKGLAEAMAAECGKDLDAMKGTASEVAKRLRNEVRTTTGDKLGTDITGGAV